jgi:hypothetical protein
MKAALLAAGFALVAASDWELVAPADPSLPPICAKSETTCLAAVAAIHAEPPRLPWEPAYVSCRPSPGCFSYESETIAGFNREARHTRGGGE